MSSVSQSKKKILFVAMSLNIGGAEKSLVNLLNLLDYDSYSVDLLLFQPKGKFLSHLPKQVNAICPEEIGVLYGALPRSQTARSARIRLGAIRLLGTAVTRLTSRHFDVQRMNRWNWFYSKCVPGLKGAYDCAIGYSGGETFWYVAEKVQAERKIAYFHSDYSRIIIDVDNEKKYLESADRIIAVSESCADSLRGCFPSLSHKIVVVQNPTPISSLNRLASEPIEDGFTQSNGDALRIVSIGRLHPLKGFDIALEAAAILAKDHRDSFEWIIVGDGEQRRSLEEKLATQSLSDCVRFVGAKENPYPYLSQADVLVQTSRLEGKSVVLDEAAALRKPVIVTSYPSASDQVVDGQTGMLVGLSPADVAQAIASLIDDRDKLSTLSQSAGKRDMRYLEDTSAFCDLLNEQSLKGRCS